jgi:hypothetical protein
MEFHVTLVEPTPVLAAIEQAIQDADPSALADIDPSGSVLRVSTSVGAERLISLVREAGLSITADQVRQLPSICCGGCSG